MSGSRGRSSGGSDLTLTVAVVRKAFGFPVVPEQRATGCYLVEVAALGGAVDTTSVIQHEPAVDWSFASPDARRSWWPPGGVRLRTRLRPTEVEAAVLAEVRSFPGRVDSEGPGGADRAESVGCEGAGAVTPGAQNAPLTGDSSLEWACAIPRRGQVLPAPGQALTQGQARNIHCHVPKTGSGNNYARTLMRS